MPEHGFVRQTKALALVAHTPLHVHQKKSLRATIRRQVEDLLDRGIDIAA